MPSGFFDGLTIGLVVWLVTYGFNRVWLFFKSFTH